MKFQGWTRYFKTLEEAQHAYGWTNRDEVPDAFRDTSAVQLHPLIEDAARAFLDDPATLRGERWLTLIGPAGCGKTVAAARTAQALMTRRLEVAWESALRVSFQSELRDVTLRERLMELSGVPFLVLDDLTRVPFTAPAFRLLESLLEMRFTANLPTIVTANLPELGAQDPHVQLTQMVGGPLVRRLLERPYSAIFA